MKNRKVKWALQNPSSSFFSIIFHYFSEIATYHAKNHPILFEKKNLTKPTPNCPVLTRTSRTYSCRVGGFD